MSKRRRLWGDQYLLGKAPLGQGQGGVMHQADFNAPLYYLLRDEFTTDKAAGSVNGTDAEPGPGTRTVTDTENKLSVASSSLVFGGGKAAPAYGNPGIVYDAVARESGRLVTFEVTPSALAFAFIAGFDNNATGRPEEHSFWLRASTILLVFNGTSTLTVMSSVPLSSARYAIVLRASGAFFLLNNKIVWVDNTRNTATVYPAISNYDVTATVDYFRIPSTLWLPTPLASDGFGSAFGTTDGLGHTEGVSGGIGSGGAGLAWSQNLGTWTVASGKAQATTLSGGVAVATVNAGNDDVFAMLDLTRSGGNVGIVLRYTDENNNIIMRHNGTNVQVVKTVAGTPTTLVDVAATYSASATLAVSADATKFRIYYNSNLIGTEQTISDAALQGVNNIGLRTTDTGNTFDNFRVWAKGTNGEYSTLEQY